MGSSGEKNSELLKKIHEKSRIFGICVLRGIIVQLMRYVVWEGMV